MLIVGAPQRTPASMWPPRGADARGGGVRARSGFADLRAIEAGVDPSRRPRAAPPTIVGVKRRVRATAATAVEGQRPGGPSADRGRGRCPFCSGSACQRGVRVSGPQAARPDPKASPARPRARPRWGGPQRASERWLSRVRAVVKGAGPLARRLAFPQCTRMRSQVAPPAQPAVRPRVCACSNRLFLSLFSSQSR